jgi:hypothetical protein
MSVSNAAPGQQGQQAQQQFHQQPQQHPAQQYLPQQQTQVLLNSANLLFDP